MTSDHKTDSPRIKSLLVMVMMMRPIKDQSSSNLPLDQAHPAYGNHLGMMGPLQHVDP